MEVIIGSILAILVLGTGLLGLGAILALIRQNYRS
jgi:hypothetical protein